MADGCAIEVVPCNLLQHIVCREGNRASDVRQSPVRGDECQFCVSAPSDNAQYPDVDPVLEVLLSKVFRNVSSFLYRPISKIFTHPGG